VNDRALAVDGCIAEYRRAAQEAIREEMAE
jgi:hypothetical protein